MAGVVGVDPGPMTWRRLVAMFKAKTRYDWNHTSSLMWIIHAMQADPKKGRKMKPSDFHPQGNQRQSKTDKKPVLMTRQEFNKLRSFVHAGRV